MCNFQRHKERERGANRKAEEENGRQRGTIDTSQTQVQQSSIGQSTVWTSPFREPQLSFVCPQRTPSPIQRWEIFTITSSRDSLHYNTRVPHVQCVYMVSHMCANNLFYTDTLSNLITHTLSVSQIHSDRQDTHTHTHTHTHNGHLRVRHSIFIPVFLPSWRGRG